MQPFAIKPGETVIGLGIDFANRLGAGETLVSVAVTPSAGITVDASTVSGTIAVATVRAAANQADVKSSLLFTATGSAGSVRKGTREVHVRAESQ